MTAFNWELIDWLDTLTEGSDYNYTANDKLDDLIAHDET